MGATNNMKAEKGKNNDCYHNKNLGIAKMMSKFPTYCNQQSDTRIF